MREKREDLLREIEKRDEYLVGSWEDPDELTIATFLVLREKGLPIAIYQQPEFDWWPEVKLKDDNMVAVYSKKPEVVEVIKLIWNTPEYKALHDICWPLREFPDLSSCEWGEDIKSRVEAFFWQRKAEICQGLLDKKVGRGVIKACFKYPPMDLAEEIKNCRDKTQELLAGLPAPTLEDVVTLLGKVVDKELINQKLR